MKTAVTEMTLTFPDYETFLTSKNLPRTLTEDELLRRLYDHLTQLESIYAMHMMVEKKQPPILAFVPILREFYAEYGLKEEEIKLYNNRFGKQIGYILSFFGLYSRGAAVISQKTEGLIFKGSKFKYFPNGTPCGTYETEEGNHLEVRYYNSQRYELTLEIGVTPMSKIVL